MEYMALGVQSPQINTMQNFQQAESTAINQAGAKQQQEAAAFQQMAEIGLGVKGGKIDGPIDPVRAEQALALMPDNPMAEKLKGHPELWDTITHGSMSVLQYSQDSAKFDMAKKQFAVDMQNAETAAQKAKFTEVSPGATLHDVTGVTPDFTAPNKTPAGELGMYQTYVDSETAAGRKPLGPLEYQQALKPSGVTINTGDNSSKFAAKSDEIAADRMSTYVTEGNDAANFTGDMMQLAELSKNLNTGKGAEIIKALGPYANMVGIDLKGLDEAQAWDSITSRLAPRMRAPGSGSSSDTDVKMFLSSLPALANTTEGNKLIIDTFQGVLQRKLAAADIAQQALSGDITWQEADKKIRNLGDPYSAFKKSQKDDGTTSSPASSASVPNASGPVKISGDAEYNKLPSGQEFIGPDGQIRVKP